MQLCKGSTTTVLKATISIYIWLNQIVSIYNTTFVVVNIYLYVKIAIISLFSIAGRFLAQEQQYFK
jgi:hypothetical protein